MLTVYRDSPRIQRVLTPRRKQRCFEAISPHCKHVLHVHSQALPGYHGVALRKGIILLSPLPLLSVVACLPIKLKLDGRTADCGVRGFVENERTLSDGPTMCAPKSKQTWRCFLLTSQVTT